MKRKIICLLMCLLIVGCADNNNSSSNSSSVEPSVEPSIEPSVEPSIEPSVDENSSPEPGSVVKQALDSISTRVQIDIDYVMTFADESTGNYSIKTIYEPGRYYFLESDHGYPYQEANYYETRDGYTGSDYIDENNQMNTMTAQYVFAEYYANPFLNVSEDDITLVEGNKYELSSQVRSTVATSLTTWLETCNSFYLFIEDGKFTEMEFVTRVKTSYNDYTSEYKAVLSKHNVAEVPVIEPRQHVNEHDTLVTAFKKLEDAQSYTIHNSVHTIKTDETNEFDYFITADSTYSSNKNSNDVSYGYTKRDNKIYYYTVDRYGYAAIQQEMENANDYYMKPLFTEGFNINLLEYKGEGVFESYCIGEAALIAASMGYDIASTVNSAYSTNVQVILNGSDIESISYTTYISEVSTTTTYTFTNINSTTLPIDLTNLDNVNIIIDSKFQGDWNVNNQNVYITGQSIYVDGNRLANLSINALGVISGSYGTNNYTVYEEKTNIYMTINGTRYLLSEGSVTPPPVTDIIPTSFVGTWYGNTGFSNNNEMPETTVVITENSVTVNGTLMQNVEYDSVFEEITGNIDGISYTIYLMSNILMYFGPTDGGFNTATKLMKQN